MRCPSCGYINTDDKLYCAICSSELKSSNVQKLDNNTVNYTQSVNTNITNSGMVNNDVSLNTNTIDEDNTNNFNQNKSNSLFKDKIFILIILFAILSTSCIIALTTISLTTVNTYSQYKESSIYSSIEGKWIENSGHNILTINENGTYLWYQNYSTDREQVLTGSLKILKGNDAIEYLNISLDNIKNLLNISDEIDINNIYSLKLFTSNQDLRHTYYKMLVVKMDDELISYNYNDNLIYFFNQEWYNNQ